MAARLDTELVNRGLARSREKAKALIKDGNVYINNIMTTKASADVSDDDVIEVHGEVLKYVSRGGYKLEKAIDEFKISLSGLTCLDIGASTGGFTDCMLKNGASLVYAIDVGHDQLDPALADDERVVSMEGVNFRYMHREDLPVVDFYDSKEGDCSSDESCDYSGDDDYVEADFASADVSFISLKHIFPPAFEILKDGGEMVCLVKPQFEAGREHLNKKGVVKDEKTHVKVLREVIKEAEDTGFTIKGLTYSPIKGPEGNIEYLLYVIKPDSELSVGHTTELVNPSLTVSEAFMNLS